MNEKKENVHAQFQLWGLIGDSKLPKCECVDQWRVCPAVSGVSLTPDCWARFYHPCFNWRRWSPDWFRLPPTVVKRCLLFSFWRWSGLWRSSSLCCSTLTWDCWHPWCSPCSLSSSGRSCRNTCRTLNKHYRGQPKSGPAPPANWPKPQNSLILWFKLSNM